jgi:hypothetical protein
VGVLGNFSVNYLMSKLGTVTKGRAMKARICETVFGDLHARRPDWCLGTARSGSPAFPAQAPPLTDVRGRRPLV